MKGSQNQALGFAGGVVVCPGMKQIVGLNFATSTNYNVQKSNSSLWFDTSTIATVLWAAQMHCNELLPATLGSSPFHLQPRVASLAPHLKTHRFSHLLHYIHLRFHTPPTRASCTHQNILASNFLAIRWWETRQLNQLLGGFILGSQPIGFTVARQQGMHPSSLSFDGHATQGQIGLELPTSAGDSNQEGILVT